MIIYNPRREDSGNYSCAPSNLDSASVVLHVLSGGSTALYIIDPFARGSPKADGFKMRSHSSIFRRAARGYAARQRVRPLRGAALAPAGRVVRAEPAAGAAAVGARTPRTVSTSTLSSICLAPLLQRSNSRYCCRLFCHDEGDPH